MSTVLPDSVNLLNETASRFEDQSSRTVVCRDVNKPGSLQWRAVFFAHSNGTFSQISPWDDVPAFLKDPGDASNSNIIHCVCKTPAGLWMRLEVAEEPYHPLRLCRAEGVARTAPLGGSGKVENGGHAIPRPTALLHYFDNAPWNIGLCPQTATEYGTMAPALDCSGVDGPRLLRRWEPNEVIEIGAQDPRRMGEVYAVKVLGAFVMNEGGEASWKIIAIAADDPMAEHLHDAADIERWLPGCVMQIRNWLSKCNCSYAGAKQSGFFDDGAVASVDATNVSLLRAHLRWQARPRAPNSGSSSQPSSEEVTKSSVAGIPLLLPPRSPPLPQGPSRSPNSNRSLSPPLSSTVSKSPPGVEDATRVSSDPSQLMNAGGTISGVVSRSQSGPAEFPLDNIPLSNPEQSLFDLSWTLPPGSAGQSGLGEGARLVSESSGAALKMSYARARSQTLWGGNADVTGREGPKHKMLQGSGGSGSFFLSGHLLPASTSESSFPPLTKLSACSLSGALPARTLLEPMNGEQTSHDRTIKAMERSRSPLSCVWQPESSSSTLTPRDTDAAPPPSSSRMTAAQKSRRLQTLTRRHSEKLPAHFHKSLRDNNGSPMGVPVPSMPRAAKLSSQPESDAVPKKSRPNLPSDLTQPSELTRSQRPEISTAISADRPLSDKVVKERPLSEGLPPIDWPHPTPLDGPHPHRTPQDIPPAGRAKLTESQIRRTLQPLARHHSEKLPAFFRRSSGRDKQEEGTSMAPTRTRHNTNAANSGATSGAPPAVPEATHFSRKIFSIFGSSRSSKADLPSAASHRY
eukprot:TRINITY_DN3280_c0_g1_i1.p1 TRINITY_DN3280_c0_g1~~TRINITY_DN3280_c0_g1_i1.p1  ORF type:complete len:800 (-),score=63.73 TRINITY_DN3280_c0_g1_i1:177-2576(-)